MAYTLSEVTESVGTITLDYERRRNALSHPLVEEVITGLRSFQGAKVRVVILRAKPGVRSSRPATISTSCPRAVATRSAGTTRCVNSCARSRTSLGQSLRWSRVGFGAGQRKRCSPAI